MTILKWILIVIAVLVALFVMVSFFLPKSYHVQRSVVVDADAEQIHTLVGELRKWPEWNPWIELDPTIVTTLGDVTSGVGAHQSWVGESGSGELKFTRCDAASGVTYDMSFDEGKYLSTGSIDYESTAGGTRVTWTMDGKNEGIIGRYFGMAMDSMVGTQYEKGLATLKTLAEQLPEPTEEPVEDDVAAEPAAA